MAGRPIVTPALDAGPGGGLDTFSCTVVNLKPTPVDAVTIELVRADGSTIASVGPVTAHPLDDRYIVWESGEEIAYCRVSSPNPLSRRRTAVTFCLSDDPANGCNGAMVTLP